MPPSKYGRIPMKNMPINIAYPSENDLHLRITLRACCVEAKAGEGEAWVAGTYHDPTGGRVPTFLTEGGTVRITEVESSLDRIPHFFAGIPHYELEFGKGRPFALTIETGASAFGLDLGGVPLKALTVRQAGGRFDLDFPAPNPEPMSLLEVSSGATGIELENLSNANFSRMHLSGGVAGYELNFGGELSQDAEVALEMGLSGVEIAVPGSTAAVIVAVAGFGNVDVGDGFTKREGAFLTGAAMAGNKPLLTIRAGVKQGTVQIRAT
jgi:hypothetical protein